MPTLKEVEEGSVVTVRQVPDEEIVSSQACGVIEVVTNESPIVRAEFPYH